MGDVATALSKFLRSLAPHRRTKELDPEWPSLCRTSEPDAKGMIVWEPVRRDPFPEFDQLEAELGIKLHPDVKDFYGSFWFGSTEAEKDGDCVLLGGVWNSEDWEGLLQSFTEHVLSRREDLGNAIPDSIFIAGSDTDLFYSVNNETGEVLLEEPGQFPLRVVAASIVELLEVLK